MSHDHSANPFSTTAIQPGAIPFRFILNEADALNAADMVKRFQQVYGGRAAIVGEHGTGKSTLLCSLAESLEQTFQRVQWERCTAGDKLSHRIRLDRSLQARLLVIDGFEQVALWRRLWIRMVTSRQQCGLLVTAHRRSIGLPVLIHTSVTLALAQTIVRELLQDAHVDTEKQEPFLRLLPQLLAQHHGNFRETLFSLYDVFEERRV